MKIADLGGFWLLASMLYSCTGAWETREPLQHTFSPPAYELPLLHLHRNLVSRESITGNEADVGEYVIAYLEGLGYKAKKQHVSSADSDSTKKHRFNIFAYAGENITTTKALLTSHIDTVPPFYPYELRNDRTEIWGRGSVDAKACVASQIRAFHELISSKSVEPSDLGLLFVVGEEKGGDGMLAANDLGHKWKAVIFGEPTEGKLASGHKGLLGFHINVQGQAAHSGYSWLGQSANEILVAALAALEKLKAKKGTENGGLPASDKYGATTLNIGLLSGGVAGNVVAEQARAEISVRLAGGEPEEVKKTIVKTIKEATDKFLEKDGKRQGSVEVEFTGRAYGPVDIDADVDGFDVITVNYGTDVPNLKGKHKRYLYGPGSIQVAHSDHEHLKVNELIQAVEDYKTIVKAVLER